MTTLKIKLNDTFYKDRHARHAKEAARFDRNIMVLATVITTILLAAGLI